MSEKIVQLNEEAIKGQIKELVRGSVEETLNELLEAEAEKLTHAARSYPWLTPWGGFGTPMGRCRLHE